VRRAVLPVVTSMCHSLACVAVHPIWRICCALSGIRVILEALMMRSSMNRVDQPLEGVGCARGRT
jgi:hypothetical protein